MTSRSAGGTKYQSGPAIRYARKIPHKLEQPQVRYWYSKMLVERSASDDHEKPQGLLSKAIEGHRRLGMPRHLEIVEA